MDPDGDRDPLSLLVPDLPAGFLRRVVAIGPRGVFDYRATDWRDALVVIECGRIEVELRDRRRIRYGRGAVLWLAGLPVRVLRNLDDEAAVVVAVSRRIPPRQQQG
jgi:hypothetical protein